MIGAAFMFMGLSVFEFLGNIFCFCDIYKLDLYYSFMIIQFSLLLSVPICMKNDDKCEESKLKLEIRSFCSGFSLLSIDFR
jgi:hypothetical protein